MSNILIGKVSRGVIPSTKKEGTVIDDLKTNGRLVPHATGGGFTYYPDFLLIDRLDQYTDSRGNKITIARPEPVTFFPQKGDDEAAPKAEAVNLEEL